MDLSARKDDNDDKVFQRRIFVGGLCKDCTETRLIQSFSHYGTITKVELVQPQPLQTKQEKEPSHHHHQQQHQQQHYASTSKKPRQRRPSFAFVTFDSPHAASLALLGASSCSSTPPLYSMVRPAEPPKHHPFTHTSTNDSNIKVTTKHQTQVQLVRNTERAKYRDIQMAGNNCNLLFQVQSSHLDRWVDHIAALSLAADTSTDTDINTVKVTGTIRRTSLRNISLVLVHSNQPLELLTRLQQCQLDRMSWNKSYVVHPQVISVPNRARVTTTGEEEEPDDEQQVLQSLMEPVMQQFQREWRLKEEEEQDVAVSNGIGDGSQSCQQQPQKIVFHMQAFPPKLLQRKLVSAMDGLWNRLELNGWEETQGLEWYMSPKLEECTHMISCVMLHEGIPDRFLFGSEKNEGDAAEEETLDSTLYMVGISPISNQWKEWSKSSSPSARDEICRAYYKLKEAFERYALDCRETTVHFENQVAFDCGSAPGGWTQFLIQDLKCAKVYSCDPGELSPKVKHLDGVHYLQMKSDKAMSCVQKETEISKELIHLWVSDMCLMDMEDQVNTFLQAKEMKILAPDAFFVLTLKCTTGHSKKRFDALAEKEIDRLLGNLENPRHVRSYHLFSNRKGERTVMGFIG